MMSKSHSRMISLLLQFSVTYITLDPEEYMTLELRGLKAWRAVILFYRNNDLKETLVVDSVGDTNPADMLSEAEYRFQSTRPEKPTGEPS